MPIFNPDYCEHRCPVCTRARKGNRVAKILQRIEMVVTFGGCPWGRARQRKYGVRPDEGFQLAMALDKAVPSTSSFPNVL